MDERTNRVRCLIRVCRSPFVRQRILIPDREKGLRRRRRPPRQQAANERPADRTAAQAHSLQRLPVGSDIWFVSRNRIRWQIGNKILATSPLSNLADRQHVRPVRGMPDRLSRGFWYAMSDTTETLRLFSIRIRLQTCKKRGWLGCVNPASWLPLAAGASSRNLTFALTCRAVYQNSFGAPYHFLTSHSYFTRVSSMFEWHAIEHIRAPCPYPRYNRSAPAARATSERGFR